MEKEKIEKGKIYMFNYDVKVDSALCSRKDSYLCRYVRIRNIYSTYCEVDYLDRYENVISEYQSVRFFEVVEKNVDKIEVEMDLKNIKIRIKDADESAKVQEFLFANNCSWGENNKKVSYTDKKALYIDEDRDITYTSDDDEYFEEHDNREVSVEYLLNKEETKMNELTRLQKVFLDKDTKTLIKEGALDNSLAMTDKGKRLVFEHLLMSDAKLKAAIAKKLREERAEKEKEE